MVSLDSEDAEFISKCLATFTEITERSTYSFESTILWSEGDILGRIDYEDATGKYVFNQQL